MGSGTFSLLLLEYSQFAVNMLTSSPKISDLTKNIFFFSYSVQLRMMKKQNKSTFLQISTVFRTCQQVIMILLIYSQSPSNWAWFSPIFGCFSTLTRPFPQTPIPQQLVPGSLHLDLIVLVPCPLPLTPGHLLNLCPFWAQLSPYPLPIKASSLCEST